MFLTGYEIGKRFAYYDDDERIPLDFNRECVIEVTHSDVERAQLTGIIIYIDRPDYKKFTGKEVTWTP